MLFLFQFQSGTRNCLHLDLQTYVYMMFLKFVLKRLLILQYNGYSIELFIEFYLSIFIFKKNVKTNDHIFFVKMVLKLSYMFFISVKNCTSLEGFQLCIYIEQPKKDLKKNVGFKT